MEIGRFGRRAPGRLVPISGYDPRFAEHYEHVAFVPEPLPAKIEFPHDVYEAVIAATAAVARLDQAISGLVNPKLLNRPAIRREAQSTSALEGTFVALSDVLEADFVDRSDMSEDVREVHNAVQAAEYLFESIAERPLSRGLLSELQKMFVRNTRADNDDAGRVRTTQVFIGVSRRRVNEARFVPPPPGPQLEAGLDEWIRWVLTAKAPTVAKAALAHYQFETLHPYNDGNGRLGRLIAIMQLIAAGDLREPVLNISPWLEERRDEYQDHLLAISCTGDFGPWVAFFSRAVQHQALEQVERIERLLAWKATTQARLSRAGLRGVALRIADDLIAYPAITPTVASDVYGRTYQACNNAIKKLVEHGVLRERTGRRYDRLFLADEVLHLIGDPLAPPGVTAPATSGPGEESDRATPSAPASPSAL